MSPTHKKIQPAPPPEYTSDRTDWAMAVGIAAGVGLLALAFLFLRHEILEAPAAGGALSTGHIFIVAGLFTLGLAAVERRRVGKLSQLYLLAAIGWLGYGAALLVGLEPPIWLVIVLLIISLVPRLAGYIR